MNFRSSHPAEVAAGMIRALFAEADPARAAAPERTFPLERYQEEAVRRARSILRRRGGVVVADDVGLGKTYVALGLVEEAIAGGHTAGIVVPAALAPMWKRLASRVARRAGQAGAVRVETHARLGRGTHAAAWLRRAAILVVDEAHAFRNPATRRYRALADLCAGADVVLVTATPINNALTDLYHLLRLFAADDAFQDIGVISLRDAFDAGPDAPGGMQRVLREVVVRRTRAVVPSDAAFPRRAPPTVVRYSDPAVPRLVAAIEALELAPYRERADALCRLGLLKRLESGRPALAASLRRLRRLLAAFVDAADAGRLLRPGDPLLGLDHGDAEQLFLAPMVLEDAPPHVDLPDLARSARRDLAAVAELLPLLRGADPKLEALRLWVRRRADEKVVIFTEHRDTAAALWRALAPLAPVARVDGGGAWLGLQRSGRRAVIERFAPEANGVPPPPPRERVALLIATDVLAEGLNLQDAAAVVCYDLPWNPVRLLQRIGRVDRLGSPHSVVRPYLFAPATGLDEVLRLTARLRQKLGGIQIAMGPDEATELLEQLGSATMPGRADPLARTSDPWERLRRLPLPRRSPDEGDNDEDDTGAKVAILDSPDARPAAWLVLVTTAAGASLLRVATDGAVAPAGSDAASLLERALQRGTGPGSTAAAAGPPATAPDLGPPDTALRRELRSVEQAVRRYLARRTAIAAAPPRIRRQEPAARATARIRACLDTAGSAPPPALLRRIDRVLALLAVPLVGATQRRVARVLEDAPPGTSLPLLLDRLEPILLADTTSRRTRVSGGIPTPPRPSVAGRDGTAPGRGGARIIAVLRTAGKGPPPRVDDPPRGG